MWPGLDVPTLAGVKGHEQESRRPPSGFADVKESNLENLDTLLRVSAGGSRDYILPAKCLDELSPNVPNSEMREIFQKHAIATIPGSGLSYIEKCSAVRKLPVCMSGEAGLEMAKRCQDSGLRPELLCSKEGYQLCNNNDREVSLVPGQSLTSTENGKKVPYLKPRTRLSAGPARRSKAIDMGLFEPAQAKVVLIDDEAAAKSRLETAASSILKQIDFIIGESLGFLGSAEENDLDTGKSSLRSSLEVLRLLPSPEPPELSMLHEELAASAASVAQEFPNGTVPPERRAAASEETGTIRAKAVRIRGSPESAYPFMKGSPALSAPEASFAERQEMLTDLSGIEE